MDEEDKITLAAVWCEHTSLERSPKGASGDWRQDFWGQVDLNKTGSRGVVPESGFRPRPYGAAKTGPLIRRVEQIRSECVAERLPKQVRILPANVEGEKGG